MKRLSLAVTVILVRAVLAAAEPAQPAMSVCDFAEKVGTLDGRIVNVRGVVETLSPDHDEFYFDKMIGKDCKGSNGETIRVEISWPDSHFLENPPPGYRVDRASFRRAARIVKKARSQGKSVGRLLATVEGVAYAPGSESKLATHPSRRYHEAYSGHIVIQAIRDLKILGK